GWPDLVREVAHVWRALPPQQREKSVLVTSNYGEAGALMRYGGRYGLPPVYSGHNSFWWWGPPPEAPTTAIAIGPRKPDPAPFFSNCTLATRITNRAGVNNDEHDAPVWTCTGRNTSWKRIWPTLRHYD